MLFTKRASLAGVFALTIGAAGALPALAADLPAPAHPASAAPAATYVDWGGLHIGLQAGGVWGTANTSFGLGSPDNTSPVGGFAGANIGYDFDLHNNWIIGIEADANFSNASDSNSQPFFFSTYSYEQKLDYFGTVRGRVGYAFGDNLFYGTGGWAWGHGTRSVTLPFPATFTDKQSLSGWTIGAGVEHRFTPNVIGRLQYLYTDYGSVNYSLAGATVPVSLTTSTLSLGINLKF